MIHIFCFYDTSSGIQSSLAFSNKYKHCNIISFDGAHYVLTEFDREGIHNRVIDASKLTSLVRGLKYIPSLTAMIVIDVEKRAKTRWKPYIVRSCNELDRYIAGISIGFTFNPKHLYNKLIKHNNSQYVILTVWGR